MRALSIGIDARAATEVAGGRGRVVRELLRELAAADRPHRYVCFARTRWSESLDDRFQWRLSQTPDPLWHAVVAAQAGQSCDVFLATNSYLSVLLNRMPTVSIVYDLVTFESSMAPNWRSTVIERLTLRCAVRRAAGLICISQATAAALTARFPTASPRVTVALLGVAATLSEPGADELDDLPDPGFVLAVGTLEPRKNLPRLVAAYGRLDAELQAQHPLVVVGPIGWSTGPTMTALRSLGDRCRVLGHVSDAALAELYRQCGVFCYPSLGEGFGLPVLEAMSAGAAVITSDLSSLPEVGGDAVAYVDPTRIDQISSRLEQLLGDATAREVLSKRAVAQAQKFTWASFADAVAQALERAAVR